ncbi:DUF1292 domain-containing protein [Lacticaseibacillus sharpeae]|uniref:UPF0473 protein FC18_GL002143 n=1 Tax=Lacticaseibacillus sharpeae JCM 1186 = DSM 20505 TaxID=1291052 RepID=A0A0R1ZSR5_9LACO|nr:DUF1292 domain-containing protein [Lacticaseibacillus sharpeae]KRM54729.1 hypothetical protein FC18_GL002143 [Lacticaseibacillus sharpeae JCM 1186 = DSM 20505]
MANEEKIHPGENDQQITLIDDKGNEELYNVLFTFDSEDYGKSYVLLYPEGAADDDDVEIEAFAYTPDENGDASSGDLFPIEDDDEWAMVEEVLNTFLADDDMQ